MKRNETPMGRRPTIPDLAAAAGVSISTVNRILNAAGHVRGPTRERVLRAAQEIGFYGIGSLEYAVNSIKETHRLGILLLQQRRPFYRDLGAALQRAAAECIEGKVELQLGFLEDLSPEIVAARLTELGKTCDSAALVAAQHPLVSEAIDGLLAKGVPVTGLIAPLSARGNVGYVGLDHFKVGRTAAWAFDRMRHSPCEIGILVGSHRYRNQEMNESGFRSYFREHSAGFTLLEPRLTFESAEVARETTENLLNDHPDMGGLYISGGGITGALAALRAAPRRPGFISIGYELMESTRAALIDGTLTMAIAHPVPAFARAAIATMIRARKAGPEAGAQNVTLGFEIYTKENM